MGELHAPKSFSICSNRGGQFLGRDPRTCSVGKDDEPLPQERVPVEKMPRFELNLDRVTISRYSVHSANCCVQSYVRNPLLTQRDFFTGNGISMLLSAVNFAGSVCEDSVYDLWNLILPEGYGAVVNDLKRAYDVVAVRRRDARDTSERCFGAASDESPVVGESSGQQCVRISNIVEAGEVEYLPQSLSATQTPSTSCIAKSPGKGRQKKGETPAPVAIKRRFVFAD